MDYQDELQKAANIITSVYWAMVDNNEDKRLTGRLDTVLGKLYQATKLIEKGGD